MAMVMSVIFARAMMKLTKNKLQDRRIFNEHALADLQDEPRIFMVYAPATTGVMAEYPSWSVYNRRQRESVAHVTCNRPHEQKEEYSESHRVKLKRIYKINRRIDQIQKTKDHGKFFIQ